MGICLDHSDILSGLSGAHRKNLHRKHNARVLLISWTYRMKRILASLGMRTWLQGACGPYALDLIILLGSKVIDRFHTGLTTADV